MFRKSLWQPLHLRSYYRRKLSSDASCIEEGDSIILRPKDASKTPVFTKPLYTGGTTHTRWGSVIHDSIIGKRARDIAITNKKHELRILPPTLDEYVALTPRLVTPIYSSDAHLIVSVLDLHPSIPIASQGLDELKIDILEAGTGHGALTLFLAQAIHAANSALSPSLRQELKSTSSNGSPPDTLDHAQASTGIWTTSNALKTWKANRRAVIHSVDISAQNTAHAKKIVHGYRQGQYSGNVDFHTASLSDWLVSKASTLSASVSPKPPEPYLSHVVLDLPASHTHLHSVSSALRYDGILLVFNPSITQIQDCVNVIRERRLPLLLERVLELGAGWTGGREWDIRAVKPRNVLKEEAEAREKVLAENNTALEGPFEVEVEGGINARNDGRADRDFARDEERQAWKMICRPKVGGRVVGGGFIGVWRKMKHRETAIENEDGA